MLKTSTSISAVFLAALAFAVPVNADYIVDFTAAGLSPKVTKTIDTGDFTGTSFVQSNPSNILFSATDSNGPQSATVRYDFTSGLNDFLGGLTYSIPSSLVRFEVAMDTSFEFGGGGSAVAYSVTGQYFNSGSSTGTTFSTLNFNPSSSPGIQVMYTDRTMGELQTNDIDAVEWTVSYNGAGSAGLQHTLTFGSTAGLIAAPEPTSAAMIGCALLGLVARRRRKA